MSLRYLAVLTAAIAIAVVLDYAAVGDPEDVVWGASVRGYWALFGFVSVVIAAFAVPAATRLVRRPGDYYPDDEQGDPGNEQGEDGPRDEQDGPGNEQPDG